MYPFGYSKDMVAFLLWRYGSLFILKIW